MAGVFCQFELNVERALLRCLDQAGIVLTSSSCIGVAVSGGADSVSLLVALKALSPCRVHAVTVNHNLRGEEGERDAQFVMQLCDKLGVECTKCDIPAGQIHRMAAEHSLSLEAAARNARYRCFANVIVQKGFCALCLAHNKDDQLETVLMRFLQGSSALWAIPTTRGKYIRPLLGTSRKEILSYLHEKHTTFCTDSTNADPSFLRNKIRGQLVPLLDAQFPRWQEGVLGLSEKTSADEYFIHAAVESSLLTLDYKADGEGVSFDKEAFFLLHWALRWRVVKKALEFLTPKKRISFSFISQVFAAPHKTDTSFFASDVAVYFRGSRVLMCQTDKRQPVNLATEHGFFAIITQAGVFEAGGFSVRVSAIESDESDKSDDSDDEPSGEGDTGGGILLESGDNALFLKGLSFPFVFRSHQTGDAVRCVDGSFRSAAKVLDSWKAGDLRCAIPFVQELLPSGGRQLIRCIWGSPLGFGDWLL